MLDKMHEKKRSKVLIPALLLIFILAVGGTIAFLVSESEDVVNTFIPPTVTTVVEEDFDGTIKTNVNAQNTGNIPSYLRIALVSYRIKVVVDENGVVTEVPDSDANTPGIQPYIIGGTTEVNFTVGDDWFKYGNHYYYKYPVNPGKFPGSLVSNIANSSDYKERPLIYDDPATEGVTEGIKLENYTIIYDKETGAIINTDGRRLNVNDMAEGAQVVEVISEGIQALGVVTEGDNQGTPAVTDAWGVVVNADGSISAPQATPPVPAP